MKYTKILIIMLILMLFSGCITVPENKSTGRVNTSLNVTTPIPTPIQSKYVSRYVDNQGNLHEVIDYTSQGGTKYDTIIDTDKSVTESKNYKSLQDKINEQKRLEQESINKQNILNSGIVGKWKFENQEGYVIYTFNTDGTAIMDSSLLGKLFYTYTISGDIIKMKAKDINGTSSFRYRLEDSNNLVLKDIPGSFGIPLNFERI